MKNFFSNKYFRIVAVIELVLMILLIGNSFRPLSLFNYAYGDLEYNYGKLVSGAGICIENAQETEIPFISGPLVDIEKGIYNITINYETENSGNYIKIAGYNHNYNSLLMDEFKLNPEKDSQTFSIWTNKNVRGFGVEVYCAESASMLVESIDVEETYTGRIYEFIKTFLCITIFNIVLWGCFMVVNGKVNREKFKEFAILAGIVLFASFPLFTTFLTEGDDLYFHLLRIEGIKDGLLAGQFPVRIHPTQFNGYGYANSIFYGEILLYFPALLRLAGFPLQTTYKIFLFTVNVITALIAYKSFKEIFKNRNIALICCFAYVLAPYRLTNIYVRSAVGEYCAMIFWPVISCGLYKLFTCNEKSSEYKNIWLWLVAGYTGLINTHMLSCAMGAVVSVAICVIFFKKTFRKNAIIELIKFFVTTVVINAFFLVPCLDFMIRGGTLITDLGSMQTNTLVSTGIQGNGIYPAQLFNLFVNGSGMAYGHGVYEYKVLGMYNEMGTTVGLSLITALIVFVYLWITRYNDIKKEKYYAMAGLMSVAGILALYMSTVYFPWDVLCRNLGSVIFNLQFPWRMLSLATIFLVLVLGAVLSIGSGICDKKACLTLITIVIGLNVITSGYMLYDKLNTSRGIYCYDGTLLAERGSGALNEYMLSGTKTELLNEELPVVSANIFYSDYKKEYTNISLKVVEQSGKEGEIVLPLLAYEGYQAEDQDGNKVTLTKDSNNVLKVIIPSGFDGEIFVKYSGLRYWQITDIISLLGIIFMGGFIIKKQKAI